MNRKILIVMVKLFGYVWMLGHLALASYGQNQPGFWPLPGYESDAYIQARELAEVLDYGSPRNSGINGLRHSIRHKEYFPAFDPRTYGVEEFVVYEFSGMVLLGWLLGRLDPPAR